MTLRVAETPPPSPPRRLAVLLNERAGRLASAGDSGLLSLGTRARIDGGELTTPHRRLRVALDGEVVVLAPPLVCLTRPGVLRVVAPAPG